MVFVLTPGMWQPTRVFGASAGQLRVAIEKPFGSDLASAEQVRFI